MVCSIHVVKACNFPFCAAGLPPRRPVPSSPPGHPRAGCMLRLPWAGDRVPGPVQTPRCSGGCIAHPGRRCWPGAGLPKGEHSPAAGEQRRQGFPTGTGWRGCTPVYKCIDICIYVHGYTIYTHIHTHTYAHVFAGPRQGSVRPSSSYLTLQLMGGSGRGIIC